MKLYKTIIPEILTLLDDWKTFVYGLDKSKIGIHGGGFFKEGRPDYATSIEYLRKVQLGKNNESHIGFPEDSWGIDFNQTGRLLQDNSIDKELYENIISRLHTFDKEMSALLSSKFCALSMWYPQQGYIGWHTNWNVPGYNIIFTYNPNGKGYWRHVNPHTGDVHHIQDLTGWHCKTGYYGAKNEPDKVLWHSAYAEKGCLSGDEEGRLTIGYVIYDEALWKMLCEEMDTGEELEFVTGIVH